MKDRVPLPISPIERHARVRQVRRIAHRLGFVGQIEYRHVYSQSGGAQFCTGPHIDDDLLVVYAEAFERVADPQDFSLEAIIAHECGHQALLRNPNLRAVLRKLPNGRFEEILASLVGSHLLGESDHAQTLVWKATAELAAFNMPPDQTVHIVERLRRLLRNFQ